MVLERDPATGYGQAATQFAAHGLLSLPLPPHTHLCLCRSSAMCMCVFDGHGPVGEKVSQHFMRRVPQLAFALLSASPPATAAEALTGAILQTERELLASTRVPTQAACQQRLLVGYSPPALCPVCLLLLLLQRKRSTPPLAVAQL